MQEPFQIFIDRLKNNHVEKIQGPFDPAFFEIDEPDLKFSFPVEIEGEVYLTNEDLVIHLKGKTKVTMPCSICNEPVAVDLTMENYYDTVPLSEIPSAVYNFKGQVREAFLIELPKYVECKGGRCPERSGIIPFMRTKDPVKQEDTYFPFSDL